MNGTLVANSIEKRSGSLIVFGYGNPGRQDDGLGPAAAAEIEAWNPANVRVEINYQLNVEDAADVAEFDQVLFIDASITGDEPFCVRRIEPAETTAFSSHVVKPELILAIAQRLYQRTPPAWLVTIRGYEFELEESLTPASRQNLRQALDAIRTRWFR